MYIVTVSSTKKPNTRSIVYEDIYYSRCRFNIYLNYKYMHTHTFIHIQNVHKKRVL